jgi:hypothetical protein
MSYVMYEVIVGALHMELRESPSCHGKRYTLVFSIMSQPKEISITYLGNNRAAATHIFARKVELHRTVVGS